MKNNKLFTHVYFCNSFTPLYAYFSVLLYYIHCFLQTTVSVYLYYGMCVYPLTSISLCINNSFFNSYFSRFLFDKVYLSAAQVFQFVPLVPGPIGFFSKQKKELPIIVIISWDFVYLGVLRWETFHYQYILWKQLLSWQFAIPVSYTRMSQILKRWIISNSVTSCCWTVHFTKAVNTLAEFGTVPLRIRVLCSLCFPWWWD